MVGGIFFSPKQCNKKCVVRNTIFGLKKNVYLNIATNSGHSLSFFFIKKEKKRKRKEKKKLTPIFVGLKFLYVVSSPKSRPPLCLYSLVCHLTYRLHQHPQRADAGHMTIVPLQIQRSFQSFSRSISITFGYGHLWICGYFFDLDFV